MQMNPTKIPGCYELQPNVYEDNRGLFVKTFHKDTYLQNNLQTQFVEEYYSFSHRGVLRGLHFQNPPEDHTKIVYCVSGEVLDVVVDLRVGSPTFGKFETIHLLAEKANMIYIPTGLAHGFYVLSESAMLMYKASTVYSSEHDSGILWSSLEIPWPDNNPVVSQRDREFFPFSEFQSPFTFKR